MLATSPIGLAVIEGASKGDIEDVRFVYVGPRRFGSLSSTIASGWSTTELDLLASSTQIAAISPTAIAALNSTQLGSLSSTEVKGLTAAQILVLNRSFSSSTRSNWRC